VKVFFRLRKVESGYFFHFWRPSHTERSTGFPPLIQKIKRHVLTIFPVLCFTEGLAEAFFLYRLTYEKPPGRAGYLLLSCPVG